MHQEPKPNQDIKEFAEKYVDLAQGNVFLFAKSNLNHVACTYHGDDACSPVSTECCAQNDAIYNLLLSYPLRCERCTMPSTLEKPISWNFNKIFVDQQGKPSTDEILGAEDWTDLNLYIDRILGGSTSQTSVSPPTVSPFWCLFGIFFAGIIIASSVTWSRRKQKGLKAADDTPYLRVM